MDSRSKRASQATGTTADTSDTTPTASPVNRSRTDTSAAEQLAVPPASWITLALAAVLVAGCRVAGNLLTAAGVDLHLGDAWPLHGFWRPSDAGPRLLLAVAVAGLAVWHAARLARSLRWSWLLVGGYVAAVVWTVALAVSDGAAGLTRPLSTRHEYPRDVDRVTDLGSFLGTFTDYIVGEPRWVAHVAGHPPGAFGTFVLLDRIGLGDGIWPGVVCIVVGAASVPAVLSTVRVLGDASVARRAAPFVTFAPAALWLGVSADALFTGVSAAGICALAHAARRRGPSCDVLAVVGGLALGVTLFLSYGLTLLGPLAIAVVVIRRRVRPLLVGGVAVVAVVAGFAAGGFWWWEGLTLTVERVHLGAAWQDRPQPYFWFANLAAFAIAVGPAVVAAVPLVRRLWRRRAWRGGPDAWLVLPAGALLAVAIAGVTGLTTGEVERIYLPFAVWLLPLAALLPARTGRGWLAAQVVTALTLETLLRLSW